MLRCSRNGFYLTESAAYKGSIITQDVRARQRRASCCQKENPMSSLKAGAMLSLFSGFSFEGVQRAAKKRASSCYDHYPAPPQKKAAHAKAAAATYDGRIQPSWNAVAHAARFAPHILRGSFGI